jgi:hypothetical protein
MTANNDIPEGWSKPKPPPKEPKIERVSIEKLLDDYTIPVLAEAVEKLNVQTYDDTGRRILATNGGTHESKSKAFALNHLAHRYFMLQNPGPDDYLFDERLEIEGSPLDLFGWPKAELPDLDSVNPHHSSTIKALPTATLATSWIINAQTIAKNYLSRHNAKALHPNMKETSEHVAAEMRKLKIYGPQKRPLEPGYIKRHALQGEFWKGRNGY